MCDTASVGPLLTSLLLDETFQWLGHSASLVCVYVCILHVCSGIIREEIVGNEELRLRQWELGGIHTNINSNPIRRERVFKEKKVYYSFT